ncbi:protein-tyrosine-phosphatase MKP1 [Selaginella moellendorffii]|nr:protein-tyrosine-phosphatase MKP1 [Selaginella moellendorffii]|eukprot:XP_002990110.2 protein-tyrosine-phosphatase MKP1 [Selaginella moellendorffii]
MDDQGEAQRSETFLRSNLDSSCATPRHQWRSPDWNPLNKQPHTPFASLNSHSLTTKDIAVDSSNSTASSSDILCPPMGSFAVSNLDETQGQSIDPWKKKLPMKLDLAALSRKVDDHLSEDKMPNPDISESDNDLHLRRQKMAMCDRQCTRVMGHLYFGSKKVAENYAMLRRFRITHILNCVGMVCPSYFPNDFSYKTLWLQDSPSEDLICVLYDVFDFIEDVREQAGGRVFVHCCQGVSRSASLIIAYVMWRERRSFDHVYDDVKQRRSVTCPNIGFVFQLTQWQKRVLDANRAAVSCNTVAIMYRMTPHSHFCPLQLVPKAVHGPPTSDLLDSRGVFVLQLPNRLYVWRGRGSDKAMAAAAERAAFQLVRYEHAQGPIVVAVEGREPPFLLNALRREHLLSGPDINSQAQRGAFAEHINYAGKAPFGLKLVRAYDADFELYRQGLAANGGAVSVDFNAGLQPHPISNFPASPRVGRWRVMRPQINHIATRW